MYNAQKIPDYHLLRSQCLLLRYAQIPGQETYEFGSTTQDARHFDRYVLKVLQEEKETLEGLFNSNND